MIFHTLMEGAWTSNTIRATYRVLYAYLRYPSSPAWPLSWRPSAWRSSSSPCSAWERKDEWRPIMCRQCIKTIMNTKTTVMNQDWVPCSMSNSSRHPQDIWWKCRDRVNHVWNFIDGADRLAGWWLLRQKLPTNSRELVLIASKGLHAHILYRKWI